MTLSTANWSNFPWLSGVLRKRTVAPLLLMSGSVECCDLLIPPGQLVNLGGFPEPTFMLDEKKIEPHKKSLIWMNICGPTTWFDWMPRAKSFNLNCIMSRASTDGQYLPHLHVNLVIESPSILFFYFTDKATHWDIDNVSNRTLPTSPTGHC